MQSAGHLVWPLSLENPMQNTITIDECERIAAEHHAAEAAKHTSKPGWGTATLTPLGEATVMAIRLGHAVAALPTAEERVIVLAAVPSSALEAIQAEPAATA
jgi:hypothetical protein